MLGVFWDEHVKRFTTFLRGLEVGERFPLSCGRFAFRVVRATFVGMAVTVTTTTGAFKSVYHVRRVRR